MIDEDTKTVDENPTVVGDDAPQPIVDYWGTDEKHRHELPDGKQWIEFKIMNEGDKVKFQKLTNTDVTLGRDNTAKVKMDPATERHTLIKTSVCDWSLTKGGEPVAFSKQLLEKWLEVAPPKIVEELEYAIRMANPWMQAEQTLEMIDEEIARLYDRRKEIVEKESGEASSATK